MRVRSHPAAPEPMNPARGSAPLRRQRIVHCRVGSAFAAGVAMPRLILLLLFAALSVRAADARFDAVDASVDALVAEHRLGGAVLVLAQDGVVVHQRAYGGYALNTRVPIASASKWLSAALIAFQFLPPVWASLFAVLSLLIIGIVGYSRIYLQVHYLSDVLAGMFLATLIVSAVRFIIPLLSWLRE